jgi:hypothetical protein
MRILVKRTYLKNATPGAGTVLDDNDVPVFDFKTLELPWKNNRRMESCIPAGEYLVQKMPPTAKRKYEYFYVLNVPGRDSILWHPGNYTSQILGCCLPGEAHTDMNKDGIIDITNTTATLKILTAMMPAKFKLTIE